MLHERAERCDGNHSSSKAGSFRGGGLDVSRRIVDADRKVEAAGLLVDREEVWVAGRAVAAFDPLLEHATGSVILRPTHLLYRLVDVEQRQNGDPAQPSAALVCGFGDPAIVRLASATSISGRAAKTWRNRVGYRTWTSTSNASMWRTGPY